MLPSIASRAPCMSRQRVESGCFHQQIILLFSPLAEQQAAPKNTAFQLAQGRQCGAAFYTPAHTPSNSSGGSSNMAQPSQPLPTKETALFRQVVKLYETKQYKKAIKAADQILKKFPDHGETLAMKVGVACMLARLDDGDPDSRSHRRNSAPSQHLTPASQPASCLPLPSLRAPPAFALLLLLCCCAGPDPELYGQEGGGV